MGVEAAMGQADLFHDLGDARAVVPSSPSSARRGRDDPFVGDLLAAWGGPPGGGSAHMMNIIYQSGAERKTVEARQRARRATKKGRRRSPGGPSKLPLLGSNQDSPDPESGVLPVTPRGRERLHVPRRHVPRNSTSSSDTRAATSWTVASWRRATVQWS